MEECHRMGVKSSFSCPYTPQQNYSEGYLGRITTMASFAMVLSGAPLFMWRWAVICAAFINNITATYFKKEQVWATPWEVTHGEPFPDSSIVIPFGCAALVKLVKDDRENFKSTCAMVIFIHYARILLTKNKENPVPPRLHLPARDFPDARGKDTHWTYSRRGDSADFPSATSS